jgi:hypothetical protein
MDYHLQYDGGTFYSSALYNLKSKIHAIESLHRIRQRSTGPHTEGFPKAGKRGKIKERDENY